MEAATAHLRALARRVVDAYAARIPTRAALLAGSAARGDADVYSDADILFYADELPATEEAAAVREALGGSDLRPIFGTGEGFAEEFFVDGVSVQIGYTTVAAVDEALDKLLVRFEKIDTPLQKVAGGLADGLVLLDDGVLAAWRERVRDYPEGLRRAMVERHWRFFPLWWYADALRTRDAELFRIEMLLDATFNLLAVLAGVNRVYFSRFQVKRLRALAARLEHAPPDLADRLESLVRLPPDEADEELARLVLETQAIVRRELPDVDVTLRHPPGERIRPWSA